MSIDNRYWRDVLKGAWSNTLHRVGWDTTKAILAAAAFIGSWILGGVVFSATGGFLIGIAILAPVVFIWGVIQTQADMYSSLATQIAAARATTAAAERPSTRPDYEKWRHVETLELAKAAQLWEGERPSLSMKGPVAETYAMLCAAIKKGDLPIIGSAISSDASFRETAHQMEQQSPSTNTLVTRSGLKAFATKYGYDPEFLRDRSNGA